MEEAKRIELEKLLKELEGIKGRHTELISVYVPAGYNLNVIARQLEQEKSTASNIKSKATRKNVLDALERLTRHLKLYKTTPENGLALFCGNISKAEGQQDIKLYAVEPVQPLKTKLYRCNQQFLLEPLKIMLEAKEVYGLLVIEREQAVIGLLEGKHIEVLLKLTSGIPGKTEKGGQSAARFARLREEMAKEFYRRVAEHMKEIFFGMEKLSGILIGGPGPTKEDFLKEGELVTALKEKIIAIKDIGYADEHGLELLVAACEDILAEHELIKEKKVVKRFFDTLSRDMNMIAYGREKVKKALEIGAVDTLIISSSLENTKELKEAAKNISAQIEFVSNKTAEGKQFENLTKGIGAILRFKIT